MKRNKGMIIIATLAFALTIGGGCARRGVDISVKGENGETVQIKTDKKGANIIIDGKDGKAEFKAGADGTRLEVKDDKGNVTLVETKEVDLKALGVLAYPGAQVQTGGSVTAQGENQGSYKGATLKTSDSLEKVAQYYKANMKNANVIDMISTQKMIVFTSEDGDITKSVSAQKDPSDTTKTQITIAIMKK